MTSKIKVDNINKVSDDSNIINKCGTAISVGASGNTVAVTGNDIRSDSYKAADGGVIASQSGTTITLGASGDTIELASGASQTGFGRTGTVDWITTPKVTGDSPVTGVSGKGYFLNTTAGTITLNLPAGAAGGIVSMADYAGTWQTYNVTVSPNGTDKMGGINADVTLSTEGQSVTFVYVDAVQGWLNTMDSTSNVRANPNLTATGGCITTCGDYKIHTFLAPGTFCVANVSATPANNTVSYMVVAGGGGTPGGGFGGGGAGGYREYRAPVSGCYAVSPKNGNPGGTAITVTAQPYPIQVGGGGAAGPAPPAPREGAPGDVSSFDTVTSAGGGQGKSNGAGPTGNGNGGSGGGGGRDGTPAGSGNTPPTTPPQGSNGGVGQFGSPNYGGGGGGGATGSGGCGSPSAGGPGGCGATTSINGTPTARASGGGGGAYSGPGGGSAAPGGGGAQGSNGSTNTGGGGGGSVGSSSTGKQGGSGIVIIRYKFQ